MKQNNNILYLALLFVATATTGVFVGKMLKSHFEVQEAMTADSDMVDTVAVAEPSVIEEIPQQEEVAIEHPVKEVEKKLDQSEKEVEPVLSKDEVKEKILSQTLNYKLYCSRNRTPSFRVVNHRPGERITDENDVYMKMQNSTENHWNDFNVVDLSCDNKGKITAITIKAIYE